MSLPSTDPTLADSKINIFLPLDIPPFGLEGFDRSSLVNLKAPQPLIAKPIEAKNDLYCKACKKKFSNQATWQNHIKSSKHIANEKKNKVPSIPQPKNSPVEDNPLIKGGSG
ncbi:hypothetical protein CLU79DRAFT_724809 [Phycomyces nitens]|nr:hypothetical protein CLU79DRAFT_724809 [Phycomyces nitens]